MAKAIGVNHQNIYRWESGKAQPSLEMCIKLADYFGVSLDELAHGVQPPEPDLDRLVRHLRELSPLDRELVIHMLSLTFRAVQELGPEE